MLAKSIPDNVYINCSSGVKQWKRTKNICIINKNLDLKLFWHYSRCTSCYLIMVIASTLSFGDHNRDRPSQFRKACLALEVGTDLGSIGRVGFIEKGPNFGFELLPPGELVFVVGLLEAELPGDILVARLIRVEVQPVQDGQRILRVSMLPGQNTRQRLVNTYAAFCSCASDKARSFFCFTSLIISSSALKLLTRKGGEKRANTLLQVAFDR